MGSPTGSFDTLDAFDAASAPQDLTASDQAPAPADQSQLDVINPASGPDLSATPSPAAAPIPLLTMGSTGSPGLSVPALYITLDDNVQLTVWNSNPTLTTLQFQLRILKPDGTIVIGSFTLQNLTADRTPNSISVGQVEGFILGAVLAPPGVAVVNGECWITLSLIRGTAASPLMVQQLVADYFSSGSQPGWPTTAFQSAVDGAGKVYKLLGPVPAAGADAVIPQPANTRWLVTAIAVHLVTSAAVGNRTVSMLLNFGTGPSLTLPAPAVQAPSTGVDYSYAPGIVTSGADPLHQLIALPSPLLLGHMVSITTSTTGIQPGDQYTGIALGLQEWIDV